MRAVDVTTGGGLGYRDWRIDIAESPSEHLTSIVSAAVPIGGRDRLYTIPLISRLPPSMRAQVEHAFSDSLQLLWHVVSVSSYSRLSPLSTSIIDFWIFGDGLRIVSDSKGAPAQEDNR